MYKIINKDYLTTQFTNFFKAIEGIFSRQGHKHTKSDITDLTIPTQLSELSDDSTHRLVTDTEKSAWNNKSDFSGDYNDLDNKPTIPSISGLATVTQVETAEDNANGYTDQKIADLINGAPSTLDTLKEIADAMTTQSSVVEALDKAIGTKQDKITETNKLSYNLLSDTPNIPSEVTESTVSGWGFTKNSGTYSKPTNGIPKTDLDSSVQSSLGKADTALQSYTETDPTVPSHVKSITTTNITNWNNKAETSDIPTKTSQLTNDSGFLTSHQSISGKEDSSNKVSAWSTTTNNTHYPSEKLVKDSLDNKVDKVSGKGLSTNDFTTTYKTAIDNLPTSYAPTNAEKNTIVGIQKNGTDLTIDTNRKVNITVPTKASDIGAMANTVTHLSGDVPTTRKINDKALSADITLTASDVGARASDWTPSKSDVGLGNVGNFKAVSTVANQGLTDTEKANARANIGVSASTFSGSYNDLTDKPTIPTVNNATLTIQKNGTNVTTFTANASSNATANITVPTKVSELTNDSGYLTSHQSLSGYATQSWVESKNYLTGITKSQVTTALGYTPPTQDTNTTYTFASGDANGQIKVTPSGGTAQNISVKGLGSLAYSNATIPTKLSELSGDSSHRTVTELQIANWSVSSKSTVLNTILQSGSDTVIIENDIFTEDCRIDVYAKDKNINYTDIRVDGTDTTYIGEIWCYLTPSSANQAATVSRGDYNTYNDKSFVVGEYRDVNLTFNSLSNLKDMLEIKQNVDDGYADNGECYIDVTVKTLDDGRTHYLYKAQYPSKLGNKNLFKLTGTIEGDRDVQVFMSIDEVIEPTVGSKLTITFPPQEEDVNIQVVVK